MQILLQRIVALSVFILFSTFVSAQIIFQETFDEPSGSTSGVGSGVNWSSSCPSCLTGDYWEVQGGVFEGNDTNGEAEWVTTGSIDISSCSFVDVGFDIQSVGTMEACGTGCNSADWVLFQYNIDGTGWVDPTNSYFCSGPCAGMNVVADDDYSGTYSTGCVAMNGNTLQLRIAVQCWAGSEYWQIDNIEVSCASPDAGLDASISICNSASSIDLLNVLSGTPDNGGTWSGPSNLIGGDLGSFDPSTMLAGIYTYTVGTAPCTTSSTVDVSFSAGAPINAGNDQTICFGNTASLTATGGVSYVWDNGLGNGATHSVSPTGTTTYTVTGTDANGCTGSDQVIVNLNQNPTPMITGALTYCAGFSASLSTTNPYSSYVWSTGSNTANTNATAVNNPVSVTVTDAAGCIGTSTGVNVVETTAIINDSSVEICQGQSIAIHGNNETSSGIYSQTFVLPNGCDSTSNITLTVNPLPVIDAGVDQVLCNDGTQVILTSTGSTNPIWDNGVLDGVPFNPAVGTTTYNVSSTDVNGCTGTDQVSINNQPLPAVSAGADQSICNGDYATLAGSGANSYIWNNGVTDNVSFLPSLGTTIYTVTGTDANGCDNSDQVEVVVSAIPTVSAGVDLIVCPEDQVNLSGSGALNYSWDNGVTNGVDFVPTSSSIYTVIGTDVNGCSSSDDVLVTLQTTPIMSFYGDQLTGCSPLEVNFVNSTPGSFIEAVWSFGNGEEINSLGTVSATYTAPGAYDVTLSLTTLEGCVVDETYTDYVFVEDNPVASFTPSSSVLNNSNSEVFFNNTSIGATNYLWDFGDGNQSDLENPSHDFDLSVSSNYSIELVAISSIGCLDTATVELTSGDELIYYIPNSFTPDGDEFNQTFQPVFTEGFDPFDYTLLIFNRWGEVVFESHDVSIGWDGTYTNSNNPITGMFTWKVEFKTSMSDERIVDVGHVNILR